MTGTTTPASGGNPVPHSPSQGTGVPTDGMPVEPDNGTAPVSTTGMPPHCRTQAAPAPVTGRLHKPCSRPPKRRDAAYDRRPAAGPGRTPRRAQRQSEPTRQVHVELPDETPHLTPAAAGALLRILLKAHVARDAEEGDHLVTDRLAQSATGQEGKG